jgi:rfaE bifunctional protein kinase chain/domain
MSIKLKVNHIPECQEFLNAISKLNVVIIGDVMIDSYLWGRVDRISPEAPVPVVLINKRDQRLGGAANVALNVQSMGATPILCSVIGNDREGREFVELLNNNNLSAEGIVESKSRITTKKHRVLAGSHQMIRLDAEQDTPLNKSEYEVLLERLTNILPKADVVIFEDYDKGVLTEKLITEIVERCIKAGVPTVVDPKKRNFLAYKNVSLFKPNKKELIEGLKLDSGLNTIADVRDAVQLLKKELNPETVLITLSEQGVYIESEENNHHIQAHKREISDVSGAGDTVISVAALCYALGLPVELLAAIANLAGGIVCEYVGVVPIDKTILLKEIQRLNLLPNAAGNPQ